VGALFGLLTAVAIPSELGLPLRSVAGWNTAAAVMLTLAWWLVLRSGIPETRVRAAHYDPGRRLVWVLVTVASTVSICAVAVVLRDARTQAPLAKGLFVTLCMIAVVASWFLTHTAYTLRYAHLYYRDDAEGEGGVVFPGDQKPCYADFAYFAFTIGMCFQVSDMQVTSPQIRRAVLGHALLSFAYNTAILAMALNVVLGAFG
jgi:uncharacterized membrane protein